MTAVRLSRFFCTPPIQRKLPISSQRAGPSSPPSGFGRGCEHRGRDRHVTRHAAPARQVPQATSGRHHHRSRDCPAGALPHRLSSAGTGAEERLSVRTGRPAPRAVDGNSHQSGAGTGLSQTHSIFSRCFISASSHDSLRAHSMSRSARMKTPVRRGQTVLRT